VYLKNIGIIIMFINLIFQSLLKAQHVSSGIPLIIRSYKLYFQTLVYIHIWWPALVQAEWKPLSLDRGRPPHVYKPEAENTV
jgi:hypothetical protein